MKKLNLTEDELSEVGAKLANALETYGDDASTPLKTAFIKVMALEPNYKTNLMVKFEIESK